MGEPRAKNMGHITRGKVVSMTILALLIGAMTSITYGIMLASRQSDLQTHAIRQHAQLVVWKPEIEPGITLAGKVYIPLNHTSTAPGLPGVILQHGFGGLKENLLEMALSFVQRGFVVITFDMREHGDSEGFLTLGDRESDDLASIIARLATEINGTFANITKLGIVGHSLGALVSILTSYKTGIEACVALSPATFLVEVLGYFGGGDITKIPHYFGSYNPFGDQSYVDRLNVTKILENRTQEAPVRVKNLLLGTGLKDATVKSAQVYDFFKSVTKQPQPQNNTQYGSFEDGSAIRLNVYEQAPHSDQQFSSRTPEITRDAILWIEQALLSEEERANRGELMPEEIYQVNLTPNTGVVEQWIILGGLIIILCALVSIPLMKRRNPRAIPLNPYSIKNENPSSPMRMHQYGRLFLGGLLIGAVTLGLRQRYLPGIIGTPLPELVVMLVGKIAFPLLIGVIFWGLGRGMGKQRPYTTPNQGQEQNLEQEQDLKQEHDQSPSAPMGQWGSGIKQLIFWSGLGALIPIILMSISTIFQYESVFKRIRSLSMVSLTWIYLLASFLICQTVFTLLLHHFRDPSAGKNRNPAHPVFKTIVSFMGLLIVISVILYWVDPLYPTEFEYSEFQLPMQLIIILGLPVLLTILSSVGELVYQYGHVSRFGISYLISPVIATLLFSLMIII